LLNTIGCAATHLGICVTSGLSLCRGVRLGDLAFFAACGSLGNGGGLSPTSGFDALRGSGAGSLFGLAQSTTHRGVGVFCLMSAGGLCGVTRNGLRSGGGSFGLGLGQECLLADLLGSTMP
jgi:hypothetical protein